MHSLFIFNPENDLALANGTPYFTAPKMAQKIRSDLQLLPLWIAEKGDAVYAKRNTENLSFLEEIYTSIPLKSGIDIRCNNLKGFEISPWGWSEALCYELSSKTDNVTHRNINVLRDLSNRKIVVDIYNYFCEHSDIILPPGPEFCDSLEKVMNYIYSNRDCMLKAPWSGSGKGVFHVTLENLDNYKPWIKGTLRKQGALMCEVFLNKVQDFAMEFYSDGTKLHFVGYSVFENNNRFSYEQALVANESGLRSYLGKQISYDILDEICSLLIDCLSEFIPQNYKGYFGVDMMLYKSDFGEIRVMPCVELNLRMTMGLVSCKLGNDLLSDGKMGFMKILFHSSVDACQEYVKKLSRPQFHCGKLESGALLLAPVYQDSVYTAVLTVD